MQQSVGELTFKDFLNEQNLFESGLSFKDFLKEQDLFLTEELLFEKYLFAKLAGWGFLGAGVISGVFAILHALATVFLGGFGLVFAFGPVAPILIAAALAGVFGKVILDYVQNAKNKDGIVKAKKYMANFPQLKKAVGKIGQIDLEHVSKGDLVKVKKAIKDLKKSLGPEDLKKWKELAK